jgi:dTDP-4-dehydrorhamnose 3,5-epimerase
VTDTAELPADLKIPTCSLGIGSVIRTIPSTELIAGVSVQPHKLWTDDRGYFLELLRTGQGVFSGLSRDSLQVSCAMSYAGTIKAFHYHVRQTDVWSPVAGMFQVALVDLRPESSTFGLRNTLYMGDLQPWQLVIPPGVGHGYKIIGNRPGVLVYVTDRFYDPKDEGRIAYNDPSISYDWETQHK